MLHHIFSAVCQSVSVDQFTNSISIQNVIERVEAIAAEPVAVTSPPMGIPFQFTLVSLWFNDDETEVSAKQRIRMFGPAGTPMAEGQEITMAVQPKANHRTIARVPGIAYKGNGVYWLQVESQRDAGWQTVAKLPILVEVRVDKGRSEEV